MMTSKMIAPPASTYTPLHHPMVNNQGVYTWSYEHRLLSDFSFLRIILKVTGLSVLPVYLLLVFLDIIEGNFSKYFWNKIVLALGLVGLMWGLALIAWLMYVLIHKNRYYMIYEMDPQGIRFIEARNTQEKKSIMAAVGLFFGMLSGNPTLAGSSLLAAAFLWSGPSGTSLRICV